MRSCLLGRPRRFSAVSIVWCTNAIPPPQDPLLHAGGMLMNRPSIAQPDTSLITSAKLWISCWLLGQVRQTTTPGGLLPPTPRTVRQDPRSSGDVFVFELARQWRHEARGKVCFVFVVGAGVRCSCVHPTTQAHAAFGLFATLKGTLWGHVIIGNI